jgi:glycolate oxidase FAD binding subunit
MAQASVERVREAAEAAEALRTAARENRRVRIAGAQTKPWGLPVRADLELSTLGLDRIVEHNAGDLTAIVQAGLPLAHAQEAFAHEGQMLAVDPPLGAGEAATIGGLVASGDSGPLRHRYNAVRDLVLGVRVALPDGSVARAGGKVIKNVAGYDLSKLFTGSFGTLGLLVEVSLRLHPRPQRTATARAQATDPAALVAAASALAHLPLEHEALDLRWEGEEGAVLARFSGAAAADRVRAALQALRDAGLEGEAVEEDDEVWAAQRDAQRADDATVVRVSGTQTQLGAVLELARRRGARAVARAAVGVAWLTLPEADTERAAAAVGELRAELAPAPCVVLDAPEALRTAIDPWGPVDAAQLELTRRVKARFDPAGTCNPGIFLGGI